MKSSRILPVDRLNSLAAELLRAWPLWLFLALVAGLELLGGDPVRQALRFEHAAIARGQWWRLLTGHLVHLGPSHMALNLAALVLGYLLCGDMFGFGRWLLILIGVCLGISAGLYVFDPGLVWYVGLSGALHGLLVAGALEMLRRGERIGAALLALLAVKIVWEQTLGPVPWTAEASGGPVVVDAHFFGSLSGALMYGLTQAPLGIWRAAGKD